jgi:general secretion pathway protein K
MTRPFHPRKALVAGPASVRGRAGSALIIVLLLVVVLSILVGSFAFDANLELKYASFSRRRRQCEYLASSGMAIATMLMDKQRGISATEMGADDDRWFEAAQRLARGQPIHGLVEPLGDGEVVLDIVPEPGRRNVNLLLEDDWELILENAGLPEEYWPMLIDSFYDWLDTDDLPRQDGGETEDYYDKLEPPYTAKNGPLDTVRELLLIKGFTEAVLAGGELRVEEMDPLAAASRFKRSSRFADTNAVYVTGIEKLLTTYGDGKVNVQSASREVLMTLPGVDEIAAMAIIEERGDFDDPNGEGAREPFNSVEDVFARVPGIDATLRDRITVNSEYYRITSVGRIGRVERRVWGIVHFDGRTPRFLRWCEEP